uniref:Homeobox domain-containing protein n=1 Tax=Theropithecus gelada TaxID=9565 RepID=A0A8D2FA02_THEGE
MSMDPACPQSLPCFEASDCKESSLMPVICGPEENYPSLQMSPAEMPHTETVSPLPSSMDLLIQESSDSPTSPKGKQPTAAENSAPKKEDKVPVKKQKTRTLFSSTQLFVPIDRFQRQKYLSLQQMQELSNILNLSYKQVKTWFQNQRMKSKRWQKNNWPQNSNGVYDSGLSTYLPQPLLFLPPGMPGEHDWESSSLEQPDLEQFKLEQSEPEHPVLGQPLLEHSDLVHPVLEQSGLQQSLL